MQEVNSLCTVSRALRVEYCILGIHTIQLCSYINVVLIIYNVEWCRHATLPTGKQTCGLLTGTKGGPGIPGLPGRKGDSGRAAAAGPKGERGEPGRPGRRGDKGRDGIYRALDCGCVSRHFMPSCFRRHYAFRLSHMSVRSSVRPSGQILLLWYLVNGLNSFDKSDREYSLPLLMTWLDSGCEMSRSHLDLSICRQRQPRRRWVVEVCLLVVNMTCVLFDSLYCCNHLNWFWRLPQHSALD